MEVRSLHIDAYKCRCDLNDSRLIEQTLARAVKSINAKIVKKVVYRYKPYGITVTFLLAETHTSIFTWPEFGYAAIEIFLCNEKMDPYKFWNIVRKSIKPGKFKISESLRKISRS